MNPVVVKAGRDDVLLRPLLKVDAPALFETSVRNRDHLKLWANHCDLSTEAACRGFITEEQKCLQVGVWSTGQLIGLIELWAERSIYHAGIGFWLDQALCGRGIMTDLLTRVITHAFDDIEYFHIGAITHKHNERSVTLLSRLGFEHRGESVDWISYGLSAHKWCPP